MKMAPLALAAALCCGTSVVEVQVMVDMSKMTSGAYRKLPSSTARVVTAWMSGCQSETPLQQGRFDGSYEECRRGETLMQLQL